MVVKKVAKKNNLFLLVTFLAIGAIILSNSNLPTAHAEWGWASPGLYPHTRSVCAITADSSGNIWTGDATGYTARWDGNSWEDMGRVPSGTTICAMTTTPDGTVWAAGDNGYTARWDGNSWEDMGRVLSGNDVRAMTTTPEASYGTTIWAAGIDGYVTYWNGSNWGSAGRWTHESSIYAMITDKHNTVWAAGDNGCVGSWNVDQWEWMKAWTLVGGHTIYAMTTTPDGAVWVAGVDRYTARWDGNSWEDMGRVPSGTTIRAMTATPDGAVWTGSIDGYTARWNGSNWENMGRWGDGSSIYAMTTDEYGAVWAVGERESYAMVGRWMGWPPPPDSLYVDNITTNSADATWGQIAGAESYNVYLDGSLIYNTTSCQYGLTNLAAGTTYTITVRTVAGTATGGVESDPISKTFTTESLQLPSPPDSLNVDNITASSADATWGQVAGAESYNVYLDGSLIYNTTSCQYGLTNLVAGTTYTITVRTVARGMESSSISKIFTTQLPPPPFRVYWPEGEQYVKVDWQRRGDVDLSGSWVQLWRGVGTSNVWVPVKDIVGSEKESFSWTDKNVTASQNYRYQIRTYDLNTCEWRVVVESDWAEQDRPFAAPGGLRVISKTDTTATVTWTPVSGAASYQVETGTGSHTVSAPPVTISVPGMVRVKAGTHNRSQWSGTLRVLQ